MNAHAITTGAQGAGFVSGSAGLMLFVLLAAALLSCGPVRDWMASGWRQFVGDPEEPASAVEEAATEEPKNVLASHRDSYSFDLSLLGFGDVQKEDTDGT